MEYRTATLNTCLSCRPLVH